MSAKPDNHATETVTADRLTAECPTHGTVTVYCPRCLGKRGGKRHKSTTWKRKKAFQALEKFGESVRRVWDVAPEARMLEAMTEKRKGLQKIGEHMGWSKDEMELAHLRMHLDGGTEHLRHICDRIGMSPEERAQLTEDMQKSLALALGGD